jgi:hypothetical protein
MFFSHELPLTLGFEAARAGLVSMAYGDRLSTASHHAYRLGLAGMRRNGPSGDGLGAARLVRVHWLEPADRGDAMTLGLRWEVAGLSSNLFPVLDADITLTRIDERTSRLALAGCYRPPLGRFGAALDKAILGQVASATIRALLRKIAYDLADSGAGRLTAGPGRDGRR